MTVWRKTGVIQVNIANLNRRRCSDSDIEAIYPDGR
jgi:predicted site-specific integrase-resolvase